LIPQHNENRTYYCKTAPKRRKTQQSASQQQKAQCSTVNAPLAAWNVAKMYLGTNKSCSAGEVSWRLDPGFANHGLLVRDVRGN
jgi:hypothetical protein